VLFGCTEKVVLASVAGMNNRTNRNRNIEIVGKAYRSLFLAAG
jgi:hypothetical protein